MELSRRSALVVWGLVLAGPVGALGAQQRAPWPPGQVGGIGPLPWGAKAKDVEAVSGQYVMSRAAGDTGQVLIMRDRMAGRPVVALFYLDNVRGLMNAVFSAAYDVGNDCEVVFEAFKGFVTALYPSLKPVEQRTLGDQSQPFCSAANLDKVSWSIEWTDPIGNSIRVVLEPGDRRVTTTFASAPASGARPKP